MPRGLIVSVHFCDGRYHGQPEWPPSPARLFQALVAGAARGATLPAERREALIWLEGLSPPLIVVPAIRVGRAFTNYVPNNNDYALRDRTLRRIGVVNADKQVKPLLFRAEIRLWYGWQFDTGEEHARRLCGIAEQLYQLGRGVDMAWASAEIVDATEVDARLASYQGAIYRPAVSGEGVLLATPQQGSLDSLEIRFAAGARRFGSKLSGHKVQRLFSQAPRPLFAVAAYNCPPQRFLFELRRLQDEAGFAQWPLVRISALVECARDKAAQRLKTALPTMTGQIERVFVGRNSTNADKASRIRIVPLSSIGLQHADRAIRRVIVEVPANSPLAAQDVAWAFSGLDLNLDYATGEVLGEGLPILELTDDATMLSHYGVGKEGNGSYRFWRTVTPAVLPERAARRRIDPRRMREEAKDGAERLREQTAAEWAVRQALRHAEISKQAYSVRVQREPFEAKGERVESFAAGTRFAKERLWHVEIGFAEPVGGPILIGDGRYLGLGLMRPVRRTEGVHAFAIVDGLTDESNHNEIARALRRAIMARAQQKMDKRAVLPAFFSGHTAGGAPSRSGRHEHLAFVFDAPRKRLLIIAPHVLERRAAFKDERKHLLTLSSALEGFRELRAGAAGRLDVVPCLIDATDDPLFSNAPKWESLTAYRATRHPKLKDAIAAVETDIQNECARNGLPRPDIKIVETFGKAGLGLFGRARLEFRVAVPGPLLLGRDRHFGGGLFVAVAT